MKRPYVYIPPCPMCQSERTGHYVTPPWVNKNYMMIESLKHGEIIRFKKKIPHDNCFCVDCGFEWQEEPRDVWIEYDEMEEEIGRRKTEKMIHEYMEENHINPEKKKGIFSGIKDFF